MLGGKQPNGQLPSSRLPLLCLAVGVAGMIDEPPQTSLHHMTSRAFTTNLGRSDKLGVIICRSPGFGVVTRVNTAGHKPSRVSLDHAKVALT